MITQGEALVLEYIGAWRAHDRARLGAVLHEACVVVESDGTTYSSRDANLRWIDHWTSSGSAVEEWEIVSIIVSESAACAEWRFTCLCCGNRTSFRGASVYRFADGKIVAVTEYRGVTEPNLAGSDSPQRKSGPRLNKP